MHKNNLEQVKQVSLPKILADHGIFPARQMVDGRSSYLYKAPGRPDNNPSLSVYLSKSGQWLYHDFAKGEFGTNIDAMVLFGIAGDWKEAADIVAEHYLGKNEIMSSRRQDNIQHSLTWSSSKVSNNNGDIISMSPLAGRALNYVIDRGIPEKIATKYLRWVRYTYNKKKIFSGIAWPTYAGGYGIRWAADFGSGKGKSFVGSGGFSFFPIGTERTDDCLAFEGIFDFLSFIALNPAGLICDAFVLNSAENICAAIPLMLEYRQVFSYFDNDARGQHAAEILLKEHPYAYNESSSFYPANDLNDYIKSQLIWQK